MSKKDWPRYMLASVASYFKSIADNLDLPVLVEAVDERTAKFMDGQERVEVRITGPFIRHYSSNYYRAVMDVNILLTTRHSGTQANAYEMVKNAGVFLEALDEPIGIYNFGGEPGDYVEDDETTQVFLGCLEPKAGKPARLLNFGQIDATDKISQIEVENAFEIELSE